MSCSKNYSELPDPCRRLMSISEEVEHHDAFEKNPDCWHIPNSFRVMYVMNKRSLDLLLSVHGIICLQSL